LLLAWGSVASSQSGTPPDEALSPMESLSQGATTPPVPRSPKTEATKKATAASGAEAAKTGDVGGDYLAQCLRDWDAATHMTKQEWARTCRRVAENRRKFLLEQQGK
jgi:hypothetical protein